MPRYHFIPENAVDWIPVGAEHPLVQGLPKDVRNIIGPMQYRQTYAPGAYERICQAFQESQAQGMDEDWLFHKALRVRILTSAPCCDGSLECVTVTLAELDLISCECRPDGYMLCEGCAALASRLRGVR